MQISCNGYLRVAHVDCAVSRHDEAIRASAQRPKPISRAVRLTPRRSAQFVASYPTATAMPDVPGDIRAISVRLPGRLRTRPDSPFKAGIDYSSEISSRES